MGIPQSSTYLGQFQFILLHTDHWSACEYSLHAEQSARGHHLLCGSASYQNFHSPREHQIDHLLPPSKSSDTPKAVAIQLPRSSTVTPTASRFSYFNRRERRIVVPSPSSPHDTYSAQIPVFNTYATAKGIV